MAGLLLQARYVTGAVRWHGGWQMITSSISRKNFFNGLTNHRREDTVFQTETEKKNKHQIPAVGSFETNLGACGPLVDGPDYTFLDGRPTPLGTGKIRRAKSQREIASKVIQLMKETQFAIQRDKQLKQNEKDARAQTIQRKLKEKGQQVLKNKKK